MAEENKEEGGEDAVQKKDGGASGAGAGLNPKIVMIALALNAVVLIALAVMVFLNFKKTSHEVTLSDVAASKDGGVAPAEGEAAHGGGGGEQGAGGEKDKAASPEDNFIKESFMVTLADSKGNHFAKVDIVFEVADAFVRDEVNRLKPRIRDYIIVTLSSRTYEQVESVDGREFLREEIRNKINGYLSRGKISNVYFTNFVVQ